MAYKDLQKKKDYGKKFYLKHKEKIKEYSRIYRLRHKGKIKEYHKHRHQEHKDKDNEQHKKYYQEHKDKRKKYQQCHRQQTNECQRIRRLNPKNHLDMIMATAICMALKGKKAGRPWEKLTGYTINDLIEHLESKFESWMTWDNYGKWDIDHIRPKSLFNYEAPKDLEFKQCWALKNLQPLEHIANIKKSNHIT